jgi:hypothetical protein
MYVGDGDRLDSTCLSELQPCLLMAPSVSVLHATLGGGVVLSLHRYTQDIIPWYRALRTNDGCDRLRRPEDGRGAPCPCGTPGTGRSCHVAPIRLLPTSPQGTNPRLKGAKPWSGGCVEDRVIGAYTLL